MKTTAPALKIIPKPRPQLPGWTRLLFWTGIVLLLFTVILFFILQGRAASLKGKAENIQKEITALDKQTKEAGENRILEVSRRLKSFAGLLGEHKIASRVFEFVRSVCHPYVQFESFNVEIGNGRTSLTGTTENFGTLGQQLLVLTRNPNIQELKVGTISLGQDGKIKFQLSFILADSIFKK